MRPFALAFALLAAPWSIALGLGASPEQLVSRPTQTAGCKEIKAKLDLLIEERRRMVHDEDVMFSRPLPAKLQRQRDANAASIDAQRQLAKIKGCPLAP